MSIRTPLYDTHSALGATFTDFAGWSMPVRYASELAEHRAVRERAGLFDLSHMGEIRVTGQQAAAALDVALVGRASEMAIGRAGYGMIVDEDGGILDDLVTYRLAEHEFLLVANASNAELVGQELTERVTPFEAEVADVSAEFALLALQGPAAEGILAPLLDVDLTELRYYRCLPARLRLVGRDVGVLLARTGYTGEDGFEVFLATGDAVDGWEELLAAGRERGAVPAGLACRDTLRLEAGMPLYGHELLREVNPYQAGLGRIVKLHAPPKAANAALQRLSEMPPVQKLVGLRGNGRRAARQGYPVLADSVVVGQVTSGALSPTLGYPIAMAYVRADLAAVGNRLAVDVRGSAQPVEVVDLPFYRRKR